jgi:hypothetical protein
MNTFLTSLLRALAALQTKSAAVVSPVPAGAPQVLDWALLRQVSGGEKIDLPKHGW